MEKDSHLGYLELARGVQPKRVFSQDLQRARHGETMVTETAANSCPHAIKLRVTLENLGGSAAEGPHACLATAVT